MFAIKKLVYATASLSMLDSTAPVLPVQTFAQEMDSVTSLSDCVPVLPVGEESIVVLQFVYQIAVPMETAFLQEFVSARMITPVPTARNPFAKSASTASALLPEFVFALICGLDLLVTHLCVPLLLTVTNARLVVIASLLESVSAANIGQDRLVKSLCVLVGALAMVSAQNPVIANVLRAGMESSAISPPVPTIAVSTVAVYPQIIANASLDTQASTAPDVGV